VLPEYMGSSIGSIPSMRRVAVLSDISWLLKIVMGGRGG